MTTLRDTINAAISEAQTERTAAINAADAKIAGLQAQLAQDEGAFVAVLDVEFEKVKSFFGSIAQHL